MENADNNADGGGVFSTPSFRPNKIDLLMELLAEANIPENQQLDIARTLMSNTLSPSMIRSGEAREYLPSLIGFGNATRLNRLTLTQTELPTIMPGSLVTDSNAANSTFPSTRTQTFTSAEHSNADSSQIGLSHIGMPDDLSAQRLSFSDTTLVSTTKKSQTITDPTLPNSKDACVLREGFTSEVREDNNDDNNNTSTVDTDEADTDEADPRLTELYGFIEQTAADKVAVATQQSAIDFRRRYNKTYKNDCDKTFDSADSDTIAFITMQYLRSSSASHLSSNSKFSILQHLGRAVEFIKVRSQKRETFSKKVKEALSVMRKMYWKKKENERLTNQQNAYRAITKHDTLHLINSAVEEQQGFPLLYHQIHAITSIVVVQNTSRRFFEFMCIAIPDMRLDFVKVAPKEAADSGSQEDENPVAGKILRAITFKTAYDKKKRYCVTQQSVAEGLIVEQDAVLWLLLLLQALGVIPSALEAWDSGTLAGKMKCDNFLTAEELCGFLSRAQVELNRQNQTAFREDADAEDPDKFKMVWDLAMQYNRNENKPPKLHHWLLCDSKTKELTSTTINYAYASQKLGMFAHSHGYANSTKINFSLTGARKEYEQRSFNPVIGNTGVRVDYITQIHAGHTGRTATSNYIDHEAVMVSIPSNVFTAAVSPEGAMAFLKEADNRRPSFFDIQGAVIEGFKAKLEPLVGPRAFIEKHARSAGICGGTCPVEGCNTTCHFPSDLYQHLNTAHGGSRLTKKKDGIEKSKMKAVCPCCGQKRVLRYYYQHITENNKNACKSETKYENPLFGLVKPKKKSAASKNDASLNTAPSKRQKKDTPASSLKDHPASLLKDPPASSLKDPPVSSLKDPPASSLKDPSSSLLKDPTTSSLKDTMQDSEWDQFFAAEDVFQKKCIQDDIVDAKPRPNTSPPGVFVSTGKQKGKRQGAGPKEPPIRPPQKHQKQDEKKQPAAAAATHPLLEGMSDCQHELPNTFLADPSNDDMDDDLFVAGLAAATAAAEKEFFGTTANDVCLEANPEAMNLHHPSFPEDFDGERCSI